MTNNINIPIADILPTDDKTPWHPARKTIKRDEPPFPSPSGGGRLVGLVQLVRNSPYGQP